MPYIYNETTGRMEPAEIVMTPLGVAGRKNLGQILECNAAAEMTGLHKRTDNGGASIDKQSDVVIPDGTGNGTRVRATAGVEYVMRLNHIAEKKLASHADEMGASRESEGARLGEMEAILLSTNEDRLKILNHLRHQDQYDSHKKLHSLLRAIGVDMQGVNWDD